MRRLYHGRCFVAIGVTLYTASAFAQQNSLPASPNFSTGTSEQFPFLLSADLPVHPASFILRLPSLVKNVSPTALSFSTAADRPQKPARPRLKRIKRPVIPPSMVGYIEDGTVRSQLRIRFDAALHDDRPDRAEFFYAKCGCYRGATGTIIYDPNAPGPGPGIPSYVNFQELKLYGEYSPVPRFSLFAQLPFRWVQPVSSSAVVAAFPHSGGVSDMQVGLKFSALAIEQIHLTFQFRASLPSGDPGSGLGTNHASIEPFALYYQTISDRLLVEGQIGDTHPLSSSSGVPTIGSNGFAGDVLTYGIGPSYQVIQKEQYRLAGVVELVGWNVRGGQATTRPGTSDKLDASGVNILNLKIGPRLLIGEHHSLYFGYGVALTSQNWYRDIFRTEYRYVF